MSECLRYHLGIELHRQKNRQTETKRMLKTVTWGLFQFDSKWTYSFRVIFNYTDSSKYIPTHVTFTHLDTLSDTGSRDFKLRCHFFTIHTRHTRTRTHTAVASGTIWGSVSCLTTQIPCSQLGSGNHQSSH